VQKLGVKRFQANVYGLIRFNPWLKL
jgi:hypothetical protein